MLLKTGKLWPYTLYAWFIITNFNSAAERSGIMLLWSAWGLLTANLFGSVQTNQGIRLIGVVGAGAQIVQN